MKTEKKDNNNIGGRQMSSTPETDKEWRHPASFDGSERVVHISVAQKLERERDEAWKFLREATKQRDDAFEELEVRVKERDEAREDLKITQEAWVKAKAERVEALRERDETRAEAAHWKTEYEIVEARLCGKKHPRDNGIISEHEIIPKLERARDEAREYAAHYRACFFELRNRTVGHVDDTGFPWEEAAK